MFTKVETVYQRNGRRIFDMQGQLVEEFKSIDQAKKWSRLQQQANGGIGMGYVRLIKKEK